MEEKCRWVKNTYIKQQISALQHSNKEYITGDMKKKEKYWSPLLLISFHTS